MKKVLWLLVVVLLGAVVFAYVHKQRTNYGEEDKIQEVMGDKPIKIGVILPLTGPVQEIGEITKYAAIMARKDLEAAGLGDKYKIIIEDGDSLSITKTNAALRKLLNFDKVDAVLTCLPTAGNVAAEGVKGTDVVHINWGDDHTTIIKPNDFRYYAYVPEQAELILSYFQKQGKNNIAIFAGNNAYGNLAANDVAIKAAEMNMNVVESVKVNLDERDFRMVLKKMEENNPDVYFLLIDKPTIEIARKQMIELGIDKLVTAIDVFDFVDAPSLFEGMTYVTAFAGEEEFLERYKEFSKLDNTFGSTFIYDMINMVVMAFENKNEDESAAEALENIKVYNGTNGKVFQEDNYFKAKSILRKIENKKYIVVEE